MLSRIQISETAAFKRPDVDTTTKRDWTMQAERHEPINNHQLLPICGCSLSQNGLCLVNDDRRNNNNNHRNEMI